MLYVLRIFIPLWYDQQLSDNTSDISTRCDLFENLYLCGIINNL